jgi:polysaccharide biosynthesis transport protein
MQPDSSNGRIAKREPDRTTDLSSAPMTLKPGEFRLTSPHMIDIRESVARHKVLFLIVLLVLSIGGITIILRQQPVYTAEATVVFDPRTRQIVNSSPVIGQSNVDNQNLPTTIETQLQRIRSLRVIDPVVQRFDLLKDPEFNRSQSGILFELLRSWSPLSDDWTQTLIDLAYGSGTKNTALGPDTVRQVVIMNVLNRLNAVVKGHSTAIQISFWSEDPAKAAALVNAFAAEYSQLSVKDSSAAAEEALAAMAKRSDELRDQAVNAESAVEKYRSEAHLVESGGASLTSMQITQITSQLVQAEADLATAQSRVAQAESVSKNPSASPEVLASPVIQKLREDEAKDVAALAEAQSRSGNLYPTTISRRVELYALRAQIMTEIENIVRGSQAARDGARARVMLLNAKLGEIWRQAEQNSPAEVHLHQLALEASVRHTLYQEFLRRMQEIGQQIGTAQADAQVINPAEAPLRPSWPKTKLLIPSILLVATVLAACCAVCADLLNKNFQSLQQVVQVFGDQPIVLVPRLALPRRGLRGVGRNANGFNADTQFGAYSEAIHSLRVQLRRFGPDNRTVMFASAIESEGKTETAIAFARQEAKAGLKVLMIDADLRRPRLHRIFGGNRIGLAECLSGEKAVRDVIQHHAASGVDYIAAGNIQSSPVDLLSNDKMLQVLQVRGFDRIIIDSPAVLAVADARILTSLVNQTIYLVRWRLTPRHLAVLGLEMLRRSGGSIIGPVFVQVDNLTEAHGGASYVRNYLSNAEF